MLRLKWQSFRCALEGLVFMVRSQAHARWHLLASVMVVVVGVWLEVERLEWMLLMLSMGMVWVAESFNTALEQACDAVTLERDERIGRAKDLAAGAVLLAAMFAGVVGALVFGSRLLEWLTD